MIAMFNPSAFWKSLQAAAERNWPQLSAVGCGLAFAIMSGGVALAAYTADVADPVMSLALGGIAIWFVKLYARGIRALQRLIDRLLAPELGRVPSRDRVPGWASLLYTLLFVALMLWVGAQTNIYAIAGWAAGQGVLAYFFRRQNDRAAPSAFAVIDDALDRWAEPRRPLLRKMNNALGFVALSGGVALQSYASGFARFMAASYRHSDAPAMQIAIALGCGAAAIVFARLYVSMTLGLQRALFDPWRYVRPEPPSRQIERWPRYAFALIGIVLFLTMSLIGNSTFTDKSAELKIDIGWICLLALFVGWSRGGFAVLGYFWATSRERAERAHARA
jgi:hypothetical protein